MCISNHNRVSVLGFVFHVFASIATFTACDATNEVIRERVVWVDVAAEASVQVVDSTSTVEFAVRLTNMGSRPVTFRITQANVANGEGHVLMRVAAGDLGKEAMLAPAQRLHLKFRADSPSVVFRRHEKVEPRVEVESSSDGSFLSKSSPIDVVFR